MKRFMMTIALACVFATPTLAGDIPTGGIAPPPADGATRTATLTSPGEIPTSGIADQVSSATLSALLRVLRLLGI